MVQRFLAKSGKNGQKEETIKEHILKVVDAQKQLEKYIKNNSITENIWKLAQSACYLHDLGKYNDKFQKKLQLQISTIDGEIPHNFLSTAFIPESIPDDDFFPMFYTIAFHHERQINFSKKLFNETVENDLKGKLKYLTWFEDGFEPIEELWYKNYYDFFDKHSADYLDLFSEKTEEQRQRKKKYILIKGILHKCDYAASADIPVEIKYEGNFQEHFKQNLPFNIEQLTELQKEAAELSEQNIIYIASTGAGKTEYSMNWINGDKAFYLLGLRTAVNAMYERFQNMFAFDEKHKENVGLLHGESIYQLLDAMDDVHGNIEEDVFRKQTKIRQLSFPITVATADQLVPAVCKFPSFEFFYFTASYSKIIVDEIQSFSPEAIASIVVFLQEVQKLGAKFLVMTATLPPFVKEDLKIGGVVEREYFSEIKRHIVSVVEESFYAGIAKSIIEKALTNNKKVLLISNTVSGAQKLFDEFKAFSPQLLHARFIRKDRKNKENRIFAETDFKKHPEKKGKPCFWIATQIVEASLDIDFDLLLTENATIDALFQRFGRCYRKREYPERTPNIYIFRPENEKINCLIYDKEIASRTWDILSKYDRKLLSEKTKQQIIEEVFDKKFIKNTDYYKDYLEHKNLLVLGLRADNKSEAERIFRKINNSYSVIPEPVFSENKAEIEILFSKLQDKDLLLKERFESKSKLLDYTVSVQLFGNNTSLLKQIQLEDIDQIKIDIKLLQGVEYSYQKGAVFIKDYEINNNFIF